MFFPHLDPKYAFSLVFIAFKAIWPKKGIIILSGAQKSLILANHFVFILLIK